jgi:hypothetical protein
VFENDSTRKEFRKIVAKVVECVSQELEVPGLVPLSADDVSFWLSQVTREDVHAVWSQLPLAGSAAASASDAD